MNNSAMDKKKIVIIDYGMGNVGSVAGALEYLCGNYAVSSNKNDIRTADALILPGVGAFGAAMENLRNLDILDTLSEEVLENKKPFFGICLGMQLLAKDSVEQGFHKGFGWIDGHVLMMKPHKHFRVPHVGWNNVHFTQDNPFFERINEGAHFYFDHSFHLSCKKDLVVATCNYGENYVAAIQRENIFASQFHPEKSQRSGLKMLRNFMNFIEQHNISKAKVKC